MEREGRTVVHGDGIRQVWERGKINGVGDESLITLLSKCNI